MQLVDFVEGVYVFWQKFVCTSCCYKRRGANHAHGPPRARAPALGIGLAIARYEPRREAKTWHDSCYSIHYAKT
jgi:hypothetical protein